MRLTFTDRRKLLMDAALDLFSRQGYQGSTTRQIAQLAGVNEALIYRHFPTKEDLYWAVLEEQCGERKRNSKVEALLDSDADDATAFALVAEDVLRRNVEDSRFSRLLLFSALENHKLSDRVFQTYVAPYFDTVAERIRRRMQEGKFRQTDPLLAARGFMGMVIYHFLIDHLFAGGKAGRYSIEEASHTLAGIWLDGMMAPSAAEKTAKHRVTGSNGENGATKNGRATNGSSQHKRAQYKPATRKASSRT